MTSPRWFPPPWHVEQLPGGFKVLDASGRKRHRTLLDSRQLLTGRGRWPARLV
jgi:hypothetical protein